MRTKYFTIAGGNKTCLVWMCPEEHRSACAQELLTEVEQVGFVSEDNTSLMMMGGELCVNGILALASSQGEREGVIYASGLQHCIKYEKTAKGIRITFELPYEIRGDTVVFEGIGFLCEGGTPLVSKQIFQNLRQQHRVPAFGIIAYDGACIRPWVYVGATDSIVEESACGSGSIALHLRTGTEHITQPTGEIISVMHTGSTFFVHASVTHI